MRVIVNPVPKRKNVPYQLIVGCRIFRDAHRILINYIGRNLHRILSYLVLYYFLFVELLIKLDKTQKYAQNFVNIPYKVRYLSAIRPKFLGTHFLSPMKLSKVHRKRLYEREDCDNSIEVKIRFQLLSFETLITAIQSTTLSADRNTIRRERARFEVHQKHEAYLSKHKQSQHGIHAPPTSYRIGCPSRRKPDQ